MAKKIVAKVGTYVNGQKETKGRYVDIGVILNNDNGEYIMLNPSVSLAGVLAKQNSMGLSEGKQPRDNVICSIFENNQNGGSQRPAQQQNSRPAPPQNQPMDAHQSPPFDDSDIPF